MFSNLPTICHCISDGFATFLDRSLHVPDPRFTSKSGHSLFNHGPQKEISIFVHHNILEDATYASFVRRSARFMQLLKKSGRKLFVGAAINGGGFFPTHDIEALRDSLRLATTNYDILLIKHQLGDTLESHVERLFPDTTVLHITTTLCSNGTLIVDNDGEPDWAGENRFYNDAIMALYEFDIVDDITID
jgi:hypothetical protein